MRVQNPLTYGEKLLSLTLPNERYTEAQHRADVRRAARSTSTSRNRIPVHLTYQTAFVDDDGKLQLRDDVYGRDASMIAILKGNERKVADIAVERPPNTSSKPVRMPVGMFGGNRYDNGGNFFDWIFGGGRNDINRPRYYGPRADTGGRYR